MGTGGLTQLAVDDSRRVVFVEASGELRLDAVDWLSLVQLFPHKLILHRHLQHGKLLVVTGIHHTLRHSLPAAALLYLLLGKDGEIPQLGIKTQLGKLDAAVTQHHEGGGEDVVDALGSRPVVTLCLLEDEEVAGVLCSPLSPPAAASHRIQVAPSLTTGETNIPAVHVLTPVGALYQGVGAVKGVGQLNIPADGRAGDHRNSSGRASILGEKKWGSERRNQNDKRDTNQHIIPESSHGTPPDDENTYLIFTSSISNAM